MTERIEILLLCKAEVPLCYVFLKSFCVYKCCIVWSYLFLEVCVCLTVCVCVYCIRVCVCSEQPPQHHSLSAPGFSSEDLQEAQFCQELQSLTVCWLHLAEHTLRTYRHIEMLGEHCTSEPKVACQERF